MKQELVVADLQTVRDSNGRFAKGQSGNPGGRPKDGARVAELARFLYIRGDRDAGASDASRQG